jgi:hypothetical protein
MFLRLCLLGIGLAAVLSTPATAASWTVEPGAVSFSFPPELPTDLGLDLAAISSAICPPAERHLAKITASGNCSLGGSPEGNRETGDVTAALAHGAVLEAGQTNELALSVTTFDFVGAAPLQTACGAFDFSLSLDPDARQPLSELLFVVTDDRAPAGTFSGILRAHVLLHLTPVGGGHPLDLPLELDLPVGGPWTLAGGTPVLLARREDGVWRAAASCLETARRCGPFCLTGSAARIDPLNRKRP